MLETLFLVFLVELLSLGVLLAREEHDDRPIIMNLRVGVLLAPPLFKALALWLDLVDP